MSRDYKNVHPSAAKRGGHSGGGSGGSGSSIWVGIFIGLLIGVGAAVGAAIFLNKASNPFTDKFKHGANQPDTPAVAAKPEAKPPLKPEVLHPNGAGQAPAINSTPAARPDPIAEAAREDRFTFYKDLPGSTEQNSKPAAKVEAPEAKPPVTVAPPKGSYLQVGAFQKEGDADNLKAKLALMGLDASINTSEIKDKGVWHRVRIGPLNKAEDVDRIRAQLKLSGIDSNLVKN